jgi:DNA-binding NarL/FixJ family response regulator
MINTASEPQRIRILSVDDHQLLREGIAAVIEDQPDMMLIAQASNAREGIEMFRQHRPDVTLMDLRMPDMSGIKMLSPPALIVHLHLLTLVATWDR